MQSFKDQNTWLSHFTLFVSVSPHLHLVTLITESASICPVCKDLISDKMSAQDYMGFDMSSDTEVLMLLKDFLTIPPMISYIVAAYPLFVLFVVYW